MKPFVVVCSTCHTPLELTINEAAVKLKMGAEFVEGGPCNSCIMDAMMSRDIEKMRIRLWN